MIGALRHRVTIARNDGAADGAGGHAADWRDVATVWAAVEQQGGGAGSEAGRAIDTLSISVKIRARDDVTAGMRLTFRGDAYRITSVQDRDLKGRWLVLSCRMERTAS